MFENFHTQLLRASTRKQQHHTRRSPTARRIAMTYLSDESAELNTDLRILKALCALHKVRVTVNDCYIEGKKQFVKIRVAYEAAQVLHRVLHTERTENELRQAERRFKSFDERFRALQSRASTDIDSIKSSTSQLAHWLAVNDKERPELERLMVPYGESDAVTLHYVASDIRLTVARSHLNLPH